MATLTKTRSTKPRNDISAAYARSLLSYNTRTGLLRWKRDRPPRGKKGQPAGCKSHGYILVGIDGQMYLGHRLAFLIKTGEWPEEQIDHKDRNGLNNKWKNIRSATHTQNLFNQKTNRRNTSGHRGIQKRHDCNRWAATIGKDPKTKHLGLFKTKKEAIAAYRAEATKRSNGFVRF